MPMIDGMSGNLHVGLAALGAAIGVGLIGMKASEAVGRNPGAATKILVQSILAIAFAEAIVFYALFLVQVRQRSTLDGEWRAERRYVHNFERRVDICYDLFTDD